MKRKDLIKELESMGCILIRHGRKHDWYQNPKTNVSQPVPRHKEINEHLTKHIIKMLINPMVMKDKDTKLQHYDLAVNQVRHEANLAWQNFQTYLIAHTVFMAFLLGHAFDLKTSGSTFGVLITSLVGVILCVPWRATSQRNSAYHSFRMAQARELEPDGREYLRGRGREFAKGASVIADGNSYQIPWLGRVLRRPKAARMVVYIFGIVYAIIFLCNLFSFVSYFSLPPVNIELLRLLKAFGVIIALAGTILLAVGLRLKSGIEKGFARKQQLDKKDLVIPSEVKQRLGLIIIGLILILIASIIQLVFILFY